MLYRLLDWIGSLCAFITFSICLVCPKSSAVHLDVGRFKFSHLTWMYSCIGVIKCCKDMLISTAILSDRLSSTMTQHQGQSDRNRKCHRINGEGMRAREGERAKRSHFSPPSYLYWIKCLLLRWITQTVFCLHNNCKGRKNSHILHRQFIINKYISASELSRGPQQSQIEHLSNIHTNNPLHKIHYFHY